MKRVSSVERETPKKRKKSRVPRTSSPLSRQGSGAPLNVEEAKASSEPFHAALEKRRPKFNRESSIATNSTLAPAASLLETSPPSSPPEDLESVVQKLPPSSGSADMDLSDKDVVASKLADVVVQKTPDENDLDEVMTDREALQNAIKAASEETEGGDNNRTETIDLEIAAGERLDAEREPDGAKKDDDIEIIQPPRQGTGASADDAMEVDPSPSEQLEQELQLSQQAGSSQDDDTKPTSVVSSEWVLDKLDGLRADTLEAGRASIIQQMRDMEDEIARLPRADMHPTAGGNSPSRRLDLIETLIGPQLAAMPEAVWRAYKTKLQRWCRGTSIHDMDYQQRLERVRQIVLMPEEMEMVRGGDAERMACAIRVCASVTEVTGHDDEVVPEELERWAKVQLRDVAWKIKVTSVWKKHWPEENGTAAV